MHSGRRFLWLFWLTCLCVNAASCNSTNQNSNQSGDNAPIKPGRWVEQWRSPASQGEEGAPMARFSYTCLSVISSNIVYVGGDIPDPKGTGERVGIFVKTLDGGRSWTETPLHRPDIQLSTINAIHFLNETTGWLAGATAKLEAVILKTTDAGASWEATRVNFKQAPSTIFFVDENRGWMGGVYPVGEEEDEEDVVDKPSDLLMTTDGGKTWMAQRRLPMMLLDIHFVDANTGWACGYKGAIYRTTDGGLTWNQQRSELEPGEGASLALVGEGSKKFKIYGVHFTDAQNGYAVAASGDGKEGRVLVTTNGGDIWSKKLIAGDHGYRDVFAISPTEAWVVNDYDLYIYHTVDGGRRWNSEPVTAAQLIPFFDVQGTDARHMWAVGGGGIFFRQGE